MKENDLMGGDISKLNEGLNAANNAFEDSDEAEGAENQFNVYTVNNDISPVGHE